MVLLAILRARTGFWVVFKLYIMKKIATITFVVAFMVAMPLTQANAQTYYYSGNEQQLIQYLIQLIEQLQDRIEANNRGGNIYYGGGSSSKYYGNREVEVVGRARSGSNSNDDEPEANTDTARNVDEDSAELRGDVDMNDFNNGEVFFVYGEDEDQVEDIEDDYDEYGDIDEGGDDLQKIKVDSSLDNYRTYWQLVVNLDDNTDYYYQICVEYEDDDNDQVITCGGVEHFETDN